MKLLFLLTFLFNYFVEPPVKDIKETLQQSSSDGLPYNVDVLSTAFGSQDYVNIEARIVHAKDDFYAIEFINQDWDMQVYNANSDYLGLPYFKSKIRRDILGYLEDTSNKVEANEISYLGLSSYKVKVLLQGATDIKGTNKWIEFIVSKEGLLLRYESHSLSGGTTNINRQREVVRFYIQEN
ncbi:hypothetical protein [Flammeovirga sp. EKP202]|uniref:hypothetical protein n=1 Tax=Flammeovirga sp. EKP202 TaxID=2770592 RepID=UPI00165F1CB8|nr:hypothetical protein [Flammeovirga sp. EKP202]MBD0400727.1 hypothetical protein [Flammeovirga sp. EKP202]